MATITLTCPVCELTKDLPTFGRVRKFCSRTCQNLAAFKENAKNPYMGSMRSRFYHRNVVEKATGIKLPAQAVIHHIDGNGRNNAHYNLVVCEDQRYHMLLHTRQRVLDAEGDPNTMKICCTCKRILLFGDFHKSKNTHDGAHGRCKSCVKRFQASTVAEISISL